MPDDLPNANEDQRQLAAREQGAGYDTAVAEFFAADDGFPTEDGIPTDIESADLGKSARRRAIQRAGGYASPLGR